jgi:cyclohexadieny/prephenate dehydrogenase
MPAEADPAPFGRVAVLGLGLMGGSLARALSGLAEGPRVVGWSPEASERSAALASGAVAEAAPDAEGAAEGADLVVLATPLAAACALAGRVAGILADDALVTDLVSLKRPVFEAARAAGLAERWVGAHPMCGGAEAGFAAGRADLYEGARVWVAPGLSPGLAPEPSVVRVEAFWRSVGGKPARIDADAHDRLMVEVSHVPQLTANALARLLAEADVAEDSLGPGGRDMTRLAASTPTMWRDLLAHAPDTLPRRLRALAAHLGTLAEMVEARDADGLDAWMAGTRAWRSGL